MTATSASPFAPSDAPNLDGFSIDPKDHLEASKVFALMATYLEKKSRAMSARIEGSIQTAILIERELERIYDRLPEWARW